MKISSFEPKLPLAAQAAERKAASRADSASGSAQDGERVTLSDVASRRTDVAGEGSFDAEKVERIARAIREGRFMVNAGIIADKLIANAQELVTRAAR